MGDGIVMKIHLLHSSFFILLSLLHSSAPFFWDPNRLWPSICTSKRSFFGGDQPSTTNVCGKSCFENSGSFIFHFPWTKKEPGYPQFDIIWDLQRGWFQILGTWIWSSIFMSYVAQRNLDTSKLLLLAGWYEEVSANLDGIARSLRVHTLYQCLQVKTRANCQDWY